MAGDAGFIQRIEAAIARAGGPSAVHRASGLSLNVIGKYRNGESEPNRPRLVALAAVCGVDVGWLASGEGKMTGGGAALQEDLMRDCIQALEEVLQEEGLELAPAKKAAAIILTYRLFKETGKLESEALRQIITLAA